MKDQKKNRDDSVTSLAKGLLKIAADHHMQNPTARTILERAAHCLTSDPMLNGIAVNKACMDLPQGWSIQIHLEKGGYGAGLLSPLGNQIEVSKEGGTFSDEITVLTEAACAAMEGLSK